VGSGKGSLLHPCRFFAWRERLAGFGNWAAGITPCFRRQLSNSECTPNGHIFLKFPEEIEVLSNFHWTDLTRCSLCGNEQLVPASQSCQRACIQKETKNLVIVDDISDSSVQEYPIESYYLFFIFDLALSIKQISQHVSQEIRFKLEESRQTVEMISGLVPVPSPVVYHSQHSEFSCKIKFLTYTAFAESSL
jgi:hypothetical protein